MSSVAKELAKYFFCFLLILTEVSLFSLEPGIGVVVFSELCRDCKIQQTLPTGTSGLTLSEWVTPMGCSLQVAAENGVVGLRLDRNSGEMGSLLWTSWMSRNSHITSRASVSPVAEMAAMTFFLMWYFKTPEERLGGAVILCV